MRTGLLSSCRRTLCALCYRVKHCSPAGHALIGLVSLRAAGAKAMQIKVFQRDPSRDCVATAGAPIGWAGTRSLPSFVIGLPHGVTSECIHHDVGIRQSGVLEPVTSIVKVCFPAAKPVALKTFARDAADNRTTSAPVIVTLSRSLIERPRVSRVWGFMLQDSAGR
jgi:hypothetical protein